MILSSFEPALSSFSGITLISYLPSVMRGILSYCFVQWNPNITNPYITTTPVQRTTFFSPVNVKFMEKNHDKQTPVITNTYASPLALRYIRVPLYEVFLIQCLGLNLWTVTTNSLEWTYWAVCICVVVHRWWRIKLWKVPRCHEQCLWKYTFAHMHNKMVVTELK